MQKHTRLQKALVTRLARAKRERSSHRAPAERLRFGEEHTHTICCVFVIVRMKRIEEEESEIENTRSGTQEKRSHHMDVAVLVSVVRLSLT